MADIFISYARDDRDKIEKLAAALEQEGYSVWWDQRIAGGAEFSKDIERELNAAKVAIVAWSAIANESRWVRDEATEAAELGTVLPVTLDNQRAPMGFRQYQTISLEDWNGKRDSTAFQALSNAVRARVDPDQSVEKATPPVPHHATPSGSRPTSWVRTIAAIGAVAAAIAIVAFLFMNNPANQPADDDGVHQIYVAQLDTPPSDEQLTSLARQFDNDIFSQLSDWRVAAIRGAPDRAASAPLDYVLTGALSREEDAIALDLRIEHAQSGRVDWSTTYRGAADEAMSLVRNAVLGVGIIFQCGFNVAGAHSVRPNAPHFNLYLKFCAEGSNSFSPDFYEAAQALRRAAPETSAAQGAVAWSAALRSIVVRDQKQALEFQKEAREAAEQALAIDSSNAVAHYALGMILNPVGDWAAREAYFRQSIAALNQFPFPRNQLVKVLRQTGRNQAAADEYYQFIGVSADYASLYAYYGGLLSVTGDLPGATRWFERARELEPEYRSVFELWKAVFYDEPESMLAFLTAQPDTLGAPENEVECYKNILRVRMDPQVYQREDFSSCFNAWYFEARIYALMGDLDAAYAAADRGFDSNELDTRFMFYPEMAAFHRDPRFWPYAARTGLAAYWLESGNWPDFCAADDLPFECEEAAQRAISERK